ncbi:MAG: hypothetical protein ACRCYD_01115, partial [Plesiomonas sp.]
MKKKLLMGLVVILGIIAVGGVVVYDKASSYVAESVVKSVLEEQIQTAIAAATPEGQTVPALSELKLVDFLKTTDPSRTETETGSDTQEEASGQGEAG